MIIDKTLFERIEQKKRKLDSLRPLPKSVLEKLKNQFAIELAYNSNAIEGNTLTLRETRLVIEEGITISRKPLREHFEAINHQKAFEFLEGLTKKESRITEQTIKEIHRIIQAGIDDEYAGRYRDVNVRILGAVKSPPRFEKVPEKMKEFVKRISSNPDRLNRIELAAYIHYGLVEVHPFTDGNGRTARLLMNIFLMRHGYPVTMVLKVDRKKYYDCLKKADQGDMKRFTDFMGRNVERSLDLYLDAFKGGSEYTSLAKAAKGTPYSQEYLSLLARRGKIEAIKLGRNWMIKREAIQRYRKEKK
ncbi:MAG: Fic family protein [Candidatus Aenigmarchaeota archaeon]|nr:Fic family protein [Candidatus Aenigmarchaeota archaeon]